MYICMVMYVGTRVPRDPHPQLVATAPLWLSHPLHPVKGCWSRRGVIRTPSSECFRFGFGILPRKVCRINKRVALRCPIPPPPRLSTIAKGLTALSLAHDFSVCVGSTVWRKHCRVLWIC